MLCSIPHKLATYSYNYGTKPLRNSTVKHIIPHHPLLLIFLTFCFLSQRYAIWTQRHSVILLHRMSTPIWSPTIISLKSQITNKIRLPIC